NKPMLAEYKKIISFWKSSIALRRGTLTTYNSDDVCAFTKISGTEKVLVLINMRKTTISYNLPSILANTTWSDAYSGSSVTLNTKLSLAPYSYVVLK
ncbi:MAG TPA: alpha-glucosidase C-terminal domain-containing protein, partial [Bacteroidales bacterium]